MTTLKKLLHPLTLLAYASFFLIVLMCLFPFESIQSALRGLDIWWNVLFPALFPFFVISELLLGFGIVHFFGKILDPLMRPIFRLPGIAGFVLTMGSISGYPVGARLSAQLWEQKLINRREGERLIAFTTTSDPIFLIGAVCIGFFNEPELSVLLAIAHYGSALIVGFFMRYHDSKNEGKERLLNSNPLSDKSSSRLVEALKAMHTARLLDGRDFSKIVKDALTSATKLMIVVGGLVVFFSVALQLLTSVYLLELLSSLLGLLFTIFNIPSHTANAIVPAIFEVTLGAQQASLFEGALMHQSALAAWGLSFAGLSVHAQVASLISHTDIRYFPFFIARLIHACLAAILVYIIWPMFPVLS